MWWVQAQCLGGSNSNCELMSCNSLSWQVCKQHDMTVPVQKRSQHISGGPLHWRRPLQGAEACR